MCLERLQIFYRQARSVPDDETSFAREKVLVFLYFSTSSFETVDILKAFNALFDSSAGASDDGIYSAFPKFIFEFVHCAQSLLVKKFGILYQLISCSEFHISFTTTSPAFTE